MKEFALTESERIELYITHRKTKKRKDADRIKAVLLLGSGWSYSKVCEALLLDDETLRNYVKKYREGGLNGLLKRGYQGGQAKLTASEMKTLVAHLEEEIYRTVEAVIAHVKKTYKVIYTVSGMTDCLHRLGFVYKKPKVVPGKSDALAQTAFVKKYREIKTSKGKNDPIYFEDGVHPTHNTQACYGWIKRGKTKNIKSNTGRKRVNISGAINIETKKVFTVFDDAVNAQSTIELFKKIEAEHPTANVIYTIQDNARYYHAKLVKDYLVHSKIQMVFLPPYSPNLNLIERLWKFFRKKVTRGKYYEKFTEFIEACETFFDEIPSFKKELDALLTENFQIIQA